MPALASFLEIDLVALWLGDSKKIQKRNCPVSSEWLDLLRALHSACLVLRLSAEACTLGQRCFEKDPDTNQCVPEAVLCSHDEIALSIEDVPSCLTCCTA